MGNVKRAQRDIPNSFLVQTYKLVDDDDTNNIVSWTQDGVRFIIKDTDEFTRVVLPKYFKHENFPSFTRQLNNYGFKRASKGFYEFKHEVFKKGAYDRLIEIKLRKPTPKIKAAASSNTGEEQVISSSSPPGAIAIDDPEIVQENKRLKAENAALKKELHRVRSVFQHATALMKSLAGGEAGSSGVVEASGGGAVVQRATGFGVNMEVNGVNGPQVGEEARAPGINVEEDLGV